MKWIVANKRIWRIAMLVLLLAALIGPWTFDHVYVPQQYECTPPTVRLEGDFCGVKLSGLWIIRFVIPAFIQMSGMLVSGKAVLSEIGGEFLFSILLSLLVLPFISTLLLILHEGRNRVRFHLAALSIALVVSVWFGLLNYTEQSWRLWGGWLYSAVIAVSLLVEGLMLVAERRH
jgi:hypothetical protein